MHVRLSLLLLLLPLAMACTAKQDTKRDAPKSEPAKPATTPSEPATPPPASGTAVALTLGESIGPVRIGMSKADVEALGFQTHPQFSAMTIPITVYYDEADKAKSIEISLMHSDKDVTVDDITIPRTATVEQIRELLGDCKDAEIATGASNYPCRDGALFIAVGSGSPDEIWLRINAK